MIILSEKKLIIYALENYVSKASANKNIFLADFRLILTFDKFHEKHFVKSPELVYNRTVLIFNLFGYDASINLLKYVLGDKYLILSKIIENV